MELEHALGYGATYAPVALGMALPLHWLAGWLATSGVRAERPASPRQSRG